MISVVMATRNGERYLPQAIDSILNQTFKDFEFIIVNDGSLDGTRSLLVGYASRDSRIKIFNQNYQGLTESLIYGISQAKGEYIARQDDDDISHGHRLEKQVAMLDKMPPVVLVGCSWKNIDERGEVLSSHRISDADLPRVQKVNIFAHGSLMFRRNAYDRVGGYGVSFPYAQDYDLILRMMGTGWLSVMSEELYSLRLRKGSISLKRGLQQKKCAEVAKILYEARTCGESVEERYQEERYQWLRMRRGGTLDWGLDALKYGFYNTLIKFKERINVMA